MGTNLFCFFRWSQQASEARVLDEQHLVMNPHIANQLVDYAASLVDAMNEGAYCQEVIATLGEYAAGRGSTSTQDLTSTRLQEQAKEEQDAQAPQYQVGIKRSNIAYMI